MLNKISCLLFLICLCFNAIAEDDKSIMLEPNILEITAISADIKEPFTALAVANLDIKNLTDKDIILTKLKSAQARHVEFFKQYVSEIGAKQVKRIKTVVIPAKQTVSFRNNEFQILLTGLKRKYSVGEEIELKIFTSDGKMHLTYLPVIANYN